MADSSPRGVQPAQSKVRFQPLLSRHSDPTNQLHQNGPESSSSQGALSPHQLSPVLTSPETRLGTNEKYDFASQSCEILAQSTQPTSQRGARENGHRAWWVEISPRGIGSA